MTTKDAAQQRLTRRTVEAAAKAADRYTIWDADLKGFGLRVEPSGTKTYVVRYRVGGGRTGTLRQFKVGRANKLTPDEARDQAKAALAQVEVGKDPQAERVEARETPTVQKLIADYLSRATETKKASTNELDLIRLQGFVLPRLGGRKVNEVTPADIERLRNDIASGKLKGAPLTTEERAQKAAHRRDPKRNPPLPAGREVRGGKTAATKTVKLLRAVYEWAIDGRAYSQLGENPCRGVDTYADGKRERFLSPAELGQLGDALTAAAADGAQPHHVAIIRLLALTGARKNEIAQLRWSEVDLERGLLQLEDSKTGRKVVRLGAAAQALLSEVERTKSRYVFPDPRDAALPIRNLDWFWVGVRKRAGLEDVRIHDLRHSFASVGIAGGSGLFLIGKLLGHSHVATTQRYAHLADDPVRAAADKISAAVSAAMGGSASEVKPMRGAGA